MNDIDTTILEGLVTGRVKPHIYAFTTGTVPNYLKVGDTYRTVDARLSEWRRIFKDLILQYQESAQIDENLIFRDHAVHRFLMFTRKCKQLTPDIYPNIYYSKEFFENASAEDVKDAIIDIKNSAMHNDNKYNFYSPDHLPVKPSVRRENTYTPRENQQDAIDKFCAAVENGRTNLLMYAVMRFGKTFTAMCCANEIKAQIVVIVSAKADVKNAWRNEIGGHKLFENYDYFDKDSLDISSISDSIKKGKCVAIFLTLQDLKGDEIKAKHKEIFEKKIDLLIIDETHFGARAEEFGKVLKEKNITGEAFNSEIKEYDSGVDYEQIKVLDAKIRLHLSGTPYRILMGDEFSQEDIIAACQFADIVDAQREWDLIHCGDDNLKEWDNPYYGFPQMIRFAFTPSKSAIAKIQEMQKRGVSFAFSELFKPKSIAKDSDGNYKYFVHEPEILELFQAIDGYKVDSNILSFLNYKKIIEGNMCRHIVCVLPFRASCDALEDLIKRKKDKFHNLSEYEILNIAGVGNEKAFPDTDSVTTRIRECEAAGKKTLTLTVNRMLTGSTVPEWDTMLFLKDTASPQEYDQAIFRLQNQYVRTFKDSNGDIVRYNMKPQTLLVDFDPNRMFQLQELKSLFYNVNNNERGNDELEKRIARELAISPIIFLNKDRLQEVTPANIIDAVRQYSRNKSILDEAIDIPFDKSLLEIQTLKDLISKINAIDDKKGLDITPYESGDTDLDISDNNSAEEQNNNSSSSNNNENEKSEEDEDKKLAKKLAAYYTRILFFAFLTSDDVKSLLNVVDAVSTSDENRRIARHVGISQSILCLIQEKVSPFILTQLDCKIQNINALGRDCSLSPIDRAHTAMNKFMRVSESEVVMPINVADDLIGLMQTSKINGKTIFLDIASKQAELACALYRKYSREIPEIIHNIYSIATSPLTYELTRKVYMALGMPTEHIFTFYTGDLLGDNAEQHIACLKQISPDAIIAGPPYKESDGGGRGESGTAIYHKYFEIAQKLAPHYIAMFLKANWYSGGRGKGLAEFRKNILGDQRMSILHDYPDPTIYIKTPVVLRGGVCTFLWDSEHTGLCKVYNHIKGNVLEMDRPLKIDDVDIFVRYNSAVKILEKILKKSNDFLGTTVSARNPFNLASNTKVDSVEKEDSIKVYLPRGKHGYISVGNYKENSSLLAQINSWKVLVAKASPGDDTLPHSIISTPIVSEPGSICTDSHLLVYIANSKIEAENFSKYMATKFFRFMMFLGKNNQNMTRDVFNFVPRLNMDIIYTDEILYKKFGISEQEQAFIKSVIK